MIKEVTVKALRSFGLLVGGIFALIGLWPLLVRAEDYRGWAVGVAASLILPALVYPSILRPVHKAWMKLGHVLGWINTRILLSLIFFAVVTPVGVIRRVLRRDSMGRGSSTLESYRVARQPRPASHMMRQY